MPQAGSQLDQLEPVGTTEPDLPTWWGPELPDAHRSGDLLIVAAVARCLELSHDQAAEWLLEQKHPLRFLLCKRLSSTNAKAAQVHLAVDRVLGRPIVLKILDVAAAKEARVLAAVAHPNVVMVHDAGVFEDRTYIVLQWCEGRTLGDYARTHGWSDVLDRCIEAGRGLAWCHSLGIVHGDVKPSNVLIRDDRALLADFGLAGRPREFGPIAGTVAYMPPERDRGIWLPAGDVFAFARTALVALELATDRPSRPTRAQQDVLDVLGLALADEVEARPTITRVLEVLEAARASLASSSRPRIRFRADWRGVAFAAAVVAVVGLSLGKGMQTLLGPGSAAATASTEPDVDRAIALLQADQALEAWDEFQAAEQIGAVELERALELARLAVEAAERAPESRSDEASRVALLITLQLITLADQHGDAVSEAEARRLEQRAEAAALRFAAR
jgi:hypothetical protein